MDLNYSQQSVCSLLISIFCICQVKEMCENALYTFAQIDIKLYAIIFCARSTLYNMMLSTE